MSKIVKKTFLVVLILFVFFLISCAAPQIQVDESSAQKIKELEERIADLEKLVAEDNSKESVSDVTEIEIETTIETTSETTIIEETTSKEADITVIKEGVLNIIENKNYDREVQKISFENNELFVEYNSGNWVVDILKNDMYKFLRDISDLFISNNFKYPIIMKANSAISSGYLEAVTEYEILEKINNLEIGYEDWSNITKFEVKDLY